MSQVKEDHLKEIMASEGEEYKPKNYLLGVLKYLLIPFVGFYPVLLGSSVYKLFTNFSKENAMAVFISLGLWFYGFWSLMHFFFFGGIFYALLNFDKLKDSVEAFYQITKRQEEEDGCGNEKMIMDGLMKGVSTYKTFQTYVNSYYQSFWESDAGKKVWELREYYYSVDKALDRVVVSIGLDKLSSHKMLSSYLKIREDGDKSEEEFYKKLMSIKETDEDDKSSTGSVVANDIERELEEMDDMFKDTKSQSTMAFSEDDKKMEEALKKLRYGSSSSPPSFPKMPPMPSMGNMPMPSKEQFDRMKDVLKLLPDEMEIPGPMGSPQKVSEIKMMMKLVEKVQDLNPTFPMSNSKPVSNSVYKSAPTTPPRPKSLSEPEIEIPTSESLTETKDKKTKKED